MISPVSNALSLSSFKTSKWGYPAERHIGLELRRKILGSCQYKNAQQRHKNGVKALGGKNSEVEKKKKRQSPNECQHWATSKRGPLAKGTDHRSKTRNEALQNNGENSQWHQIVLRDQANESSKTDSMSGKKKKKDVISDSDKNSSVGVGWNMITVK